MAEKASFLYRFMHMDRRILFVLIILAVAAPLILPLDMPIHVSEPVKRVYRAIEKLPPGGRPILISVDYDPSTVPELQPMTIAVLHHCLKKRVPVILMTLHPAGFGLAEDALKTAVSWNPGVKYGKDYAIMGFAPGGGVVIMGIGQDFHKTFPRDARGNLTTELPIVRDVKDFKDLEMVISFTASALYEGWILYAYTRYGCRVAAGVTAVMASDAYPYLQANQLVGLLGGLSGAAEYETLINKRGTAIVSMDAQSIVHLLIIVLIAMGNVAYFATRGKRGPSRALAEGSSTGGGKA